MTTFIQSNGGLEPEEWRLFTEALNLWFEMMCRCPDKAFLREKVRTISREEPFEYLIAYAKAFLDFADELRTRPAWQVDELVRLNGIGQVDGTRTPGRAAGVVARPKREE